MTGPPGEDAVDIARRIEQLQRSGAPSTPAPAAREPESADPPADVVAAAREIERLRALRVRPERAVGIRELVVEQRGRAERSHGRLGAIVEAWHALLPAEIASRTTITRLRGGVVFVSADSAPIAYELDRLVREGLIAELREHTRTAIARIRVSVGRAR